MKKLLALLLLAALGITPSWGRCCCCNRAQRTDEAKKVHVSCKVGENKTPAQRIGTKQSFGGVVPKASDGSIGLVEAKSKSANEKNRLNVRIDRIDAPKNDQSHGKTAAKTLSTKIGDNQVSVEWKTPSRGNLVK